MHTSEIIQVNALARQMKSISLLYTIRLVYWKNFNFRSGVYGLLSNFMFILVLDSIVTFLLSVEMLIISVNVVCLLWNHMKIKFDIKESDKSKMSIDYCMKEPNLYGTYDIATVCVCLCIWESATEQMLVRTYICIECFPCCTICYGIAVALRTVHCVYSLAILPCLHAKELNKHGCMWITPNEMCKYILYQTHFRFTYKKQQISICFFVAIAFSIEFSSRRNRNHWIFCWRFYMKFT